MEATLHMVRARLAGEDVLSFGRMTYNDEAWKALRFSPAAVRSSLSGGVTLIAADDPTVGRARLRYEALPDGFEGDLAVDGAAGGVRHIVWEMGFCKTLFSGATLHVPDQPPHPFSPLLDPEWQQVGLTGFSIKTRDGRWEAVLTPGRGAWILRAAVQSWRPEQERTFILYYHLEPSETGPKDSARFTLRFHPTSDVAARLESVRRYGYTDKVASYFQERLRQFGAREESRSASPEEADRLAARMIEVSAHLEETGISRNSGRVVPHPVQQNLLDGIFRFPDEIRIACAPRHEGLRYLLGADLERMGAQVEFVEPGEEAPIRIGVPGEDASIQDALDRVGLVLPEEGGGEAYILRVTPEGILIAGRGAAGAFYGMQTLRQLLRRGDAGLEVASQLVIDRPDMPFRGFFLEGVNRENLRNSEDIRRLIRDTFAFARANALVCEIRPSEVRWPRRPELSAPDAAPISDLADLAAYARRYHLDFIPLIPMYGRSLALLTAYPELAETRDWESATTEFDRLNNATWCPNRPLVYEVIEDVIDDVIEATRCRTLHIGHDEIKHIGVCEICRLQTPGALFAASVNTLTERLARRNVQTMIWGDMLLDRAHWQPLGVFSANSNNPEYGNHPVHEAIHKLDPRVIVCAWHYHEPAGHLYPTLAWFVNRGFRTIGCPWWRIENAYGLTRAAQAVGRPEMLGILQTDWGFLNTRAPGASSLAALAYAWNGAMPPPADLDWDPDRVFSATLHDGRRPSRRADARFLPIALDGAANRPRAGAPDAWFNLPGDDLAYLPAGTQTLFGVPFRIGDTCVVAESAPNGSSPPRIIPVNLRARSLIFLHGLHLPDPTPWRAQYGVYRIRYTNGDITDVPITERNAAHWLSETRRRGAALGGYGGWAYRFTWDAPLAWEGITRLGRPVVLHAFEWVNPHPEKEIAAVELVVTRTEPGIQIGLVALTAVP